MSGKRPYRLGKRQASVDETKRRIVEAALAEYAENGIDGTSMQAVARRAEVASGTVLYHYPDPDDLAEVAIRSLYERYRPPSPDLIPDDAPLEERITVLVGELFGLYQRSYEGYLIMQKSADHPALQQANARWEQTVEAMIGRALGPEVRDDETRAVLAALIDPGFRGTLIANGVEADRAASVAATLIVRWLD